MLQHFVSSLRHIVRADVEKGKVIDVDDYCRMFAPLYPELSSRQIKDAILQVVAVYGGGAVWGLEADPQDSMRQAGGEGSNTGDA